MKSLMAHFVNVFDYLFNAEWNPEYANAAHIKIVPHTDSRFSNEILIIALDSDKEIRSMCAYDGQKALEPMEVEYEPLDDGEIDDVCDEETVEQWYRDRASTFTFHSFAPYCSMCCRDNPSYVGITENGTPFEFCRQCRDDLKRKKDEMLTSPERIGA